jgi:16S rRNA (uracil1498-N3)-methyltransferase
VNRFYAPPSAIASNEIILDLGETRHLRDVLRLRKGDEVNVFDGDGHEFRCRVEETKKNETRLSIVEGLSPTSPESDLDLTLAASMLKSEKFDLVVQKSVELGVSRLVPMQTARSDVKLKHTQGRLERWRRIALEATKQSGRAVLMHIEPPTTFDEFISRNRAPDEVVLLFAERGGDGFPVHLSQKKVAALVGPEGGWDNNELEAARARCIELITLGGRVLRAETAAIAITAVLQHRFGDIN